MPPIGPEDLKQLAGALLRSGASIDEINAVRKHVSTLKGGGLLGHAAPARVLALLLSDVVGDDVSSIASGLTAPDPTTLEDAFGVVERYAFELPQSVEGHLKSAPETPKPGDRIFECVTDVLVGSGRLSAEAAAEKARELGFAPLILSTHVTGDARSVGALYWAQTCFHEKAHSVKADVAATALGCFPAYRPAPRRRASIRCEYAIGGCRRRPGSA